MNRCHHPRRRRRAPLHHPRRCRRWRRGQGRARDIGGGATMPRKTRGSGPRGRRRRAGPRGRMHTHRALPRIRVWVEHRVCVCVCVLCLSIVFLFCCLRIACASLHMGWILFFGRMSMSNPWRLSRDRYFVFVFNFFFSVRLCLVRLWTGKKDCPCRCGALMCTSGAMIGNRSHSKTT